MFELKNRGVFEAIKDGIIVSCQALEDEPLHGNGIMVSMAKAALIGGACAIRANGAHDIAQMKRELNVPIIGLNKRTIHGSAVFITPTSEDALSVLRAGADIVALDCTDRERPESLEGIFSSIRNVFPDRLIMADISSLSDARKIITLNPDILATTLSGYTDETRDRPKPDIELVSEISSQTCIPVVAEGSYWEPEHVIMAFEAGAMAVTIGSAITRPHLIAKKFADRVKSWKEESKFEDRSSERFLR